MTEQELPVAAARGPLRVIENDRELEGAAERLAEGRGPVAVDVERASGFRYSQRAYLVQLFRRDAGTFLVDPTEATRFEPLQEAIGETEWVLHAASQDLPSLRDLGLEPPELFDTELGSRLAGFERVGLQAVVARTLGLHLKKEHSNSDWSTRPLPETWLEYAALDVELLVDVRDAVAESLREQGKEAIAREEFAFELQRRSKPAPAEPWRRLGGVHKLRSRRDLAIARSLWEARDALARSLDTAPGRLVPDASLIAAVAAAPASKGELARLKEFRGRQARPELDRWWAAIEAGRKAESLPRMRPEAEGPPPPRFWDGRRPAAAVRLKAARSALAATADQVSIPAENLLTPDTLRRTIWDADDEHPLDVRAALLEHGARSWQVEATGEVLDQAIADADAGIVDSVQAPASTAETDS